MLYVNISGKDLILYNKANVKFNVNKGRVIDSDTLPEVANSIDFRKVYPGELSLETAKELNLDEPKKVVEVKTDDDARIIALTQQVENLISYVARLEEVSKKRFDDLKELITASTQPKAKKGATREPKDLVV